MKQPELVYKCINCEDGEDDLETYLSEGGELYYDDPYLGWSFLHIACYAFNLAVIDLLLRKGFDINYRSSCGYPAIFVALEGDIDGDLQQHCAPKFEAFRALVARGASLDSTMADGLSLADYCENEGGPFFRTAFDKVMDELRQRGGPEDRSAR